MNEGAVYIAHRREEDGAEQPLLAHLQNTAARARAFAEGFGAGQLAYEIGLCHDLGKYAEKFQRRIRGDAVTVDHSTRGAQLLWARNDSKLGMMAAYCIMGHHGGLPDGGSTLEDPGGPTLFGRCKKETEDCSAYQRELALPELKPPDIAIRDGFGAAFAVRMLFSALVDADFLDTEAFCQGETSRGCLSDIAALRERFLAEIDGFLNPKAPVSGLNARRTALLKNCLTAAEDRPGLFTLTAPTGSGKTIASLAFALEHAARWDKHRVIYVVPYNTIIEQNAKIFEDYLGVENVLQHHSNVQYEDKGEEMTRKRLATENWDYPLVVTSSVQFFQSLFGNRTSVCRKLHNIAGSVLIFDEAQMIPIPYLIPCVRAIRELVERYGCTAVLATATQSALEPYFEPLQPKEITEKPKELYAFLRRATIRPLAEPLTDDALVERLRGEDSALCIVNTRRTARSLFQKLWQVQLEGAFHLSTLMYPAHRSRVLAEIRARLKGGLPCRVISTSLVEAGVDLDFPAVYREMAGLDSIVQAAGRCNREGGREAGQSPVYVFTSGEAGRKPPRTIGPNIEAARRVLESQADAASPEAIRAYFQRLFYDRGDDALDRKKIASEKFANDKLISFSFPFREAAEAFQLIEEDTETVYVLSEAPELEEELRECLRHGSCSRKLLRELGPYSLSPYRSDVRALEQIGAVERLDAQTCLLNERYYDAHCGVELSPEGGQAVYM